MNNQPIHPELWIYFFNTFKLNLTDKQLKEIVDTVRKLDVKNDLPFSY